MTQSPEFVSPPIDTGGSRFELPTMVPGQIAILRTTRHSVVVDDDGLEVLVKREELRDLVRVIEQPEFTLSMPQSGVVRSQDRTLRSRSTRR